MEVCTALAEGWASVLSRYRGSVRACRQHATNYVHQLAPLTAINAALKAYEKKTKNDLLAHPLAAQFQACKSPGDILAVLQEKVNEFDQSRSADERLSQWLNPTINVLYSFSATLGAGVGLVSTLKSTCLLLPLIANFTGILTRISYLLGHRGSSLGERAAFDIRVGARTHGACDCLT
jgi:hypothetical protein